MEDKPKRINKKGQQVSMLKLMGSALMILLFAVAMVNFGFLLGNDNNSTHAITTDPSLAELNNSFISQIDNTTSDLNSSASGFFSDIPLLSTIEATVTAIFGVIPAFVTQVTATFTLIMSFIRTQIGIPPIVLQMLTGFIFVMIVLLGWRVYKAGQ